MAEANEEPIPDDGGYDSGQFLQHPEDEYVCGICHCVLREPIQTTCGHLFCKVCLERWKQAQRVFRCPMDNEVLDRGTGGGFPDKLVERKILSLPVKCSNHSCPWTGELRHVQSHLLDECDYEIIPCEIDNCDVTTARGMMGDHVVICLWRIVPCEHCGQGNPQFSEQVHLLNCLRLPVCCTQECSAVVPWEEMAAHVRNNCPLTEIQCDFHDLGCEDKIQRRYRDSHLDENTKQHLELSRQHNIRLQGTIEQMQRKHEEMERKHEEMGRKHEEMEEQMQRKHEDIEEQMKKMEMEQKEVKKKMENQQIQQQRGIEELQASVGNLKGEVEEHNKQKDNVMPFIWKIQGRYTRAYRGARGFVPCPGSPIIYSEHKGYRFQADIYKYTSTNTNSAEVGLYLALHKGEYDNMLSWPCLVVIVVSILSKDGQWEVIELKTINDQSIRSYADHATMNPPIMGYNYLAININNYYVDFLPFRERTIKQKYVTNNEVHFKFEVNRQCLREMYVIVQA